MGYRFLLILTLAGPAAAAGVQSPLAPLFAAPAAPHWGQAFANVGAFLASDAGASFQARYPSLDALKGLQVLSDGDRAAVGLMAERATREDPALHERMSKIASLPEDEQRLVLNAVSESYRGAAREVESVLDKALSAALASGDEAALEQIRRSAPLFSLYTGALRDHSLRAYLEARADAEKLGGGKTDDLDAPAVKGRASRLRTFLSRPGAVVPMHPADYYGQVRTERDDETLGGVERLKKADRTLPRDDGAPNPSSIGGVMVMTVLLAVASAHLFSTDSAALGFVAALGAALAFGVGIADFTSSRRGADPQPERRNHYSDREERRQIAKSEEDESRRLHGSDWDR